MRGVLLVDGLLHTLYMYIATLGPRYLVDTSIGYFSVEKMSSNDNHLYLFQLGEGCQTSETMPTCTPVRTRDSTSRKRGEDDIKLLERIFERSRTD